jgi:hypothetical protein
VRFPLHVSAALVVLALSGCAATPPPRIEGHIKSVSQADLSEVTALVQRDMVKDFHRVLPIVYVRVRDHDHVVVDYWHGDTEYWVPARRIHGVWSIPTERDRVVVSG